MKKFFNVVLPLLLIFLLTACSSEETSGEKKSSTTKSEKSNGELLTKDEFVKMYSDPKKYKGSKVDFYARVFIEPEKDESGTYLQVYADNNDAYNTIVGIEDPNLEVKSDDVIHVVGTVKDVFEGENAFGAEIVAPMIEAKTIEITDYATAFAPAIKTIDVNKEIDQHGYVLKVNKIEIAEKETRLYLKITNNSNDTISFYTFDTKLITGGKQFEETDDFNYPEIQSEILPGVTTEGIIAFPVIPESGDLSIHADGSSENYDITIEPFKFDVKY